MTRFLTVLVAVLLVAQLFTVDIYAYNTDKIKGSSKKSGAVYPEYSQGCEFLDVVELGADRSGEEDSAKAIQKALNYAKDNASDSLQVKVYVPAGEYKISRTLKIYSNTWLYLEDGAVIKKAFDRGCMLKNAVQFSGGGYDSDRNIFIEGGKWDGNTQNYNNVIQFSNIRIGHARNVTFYNVEVANNKNGHHLELGGIDGLTIEKCSFHGYTGWFEKEAIQLDVMNNAGIFGGYEPFDDASTNNVVIKNNKFYNLSRGIGSHSAVVGTYYTNTTIVDNTFENLSGVCIIMYNHKDCTIKNNTMDNVGMGINFSYMSESGGKGYFRPVIGYEAATKKIDDNANLLIKGNKITTSATLEAPVPYGIRIYGKKVDKAPLPTYNFRVQGVKITGNTIKTEAQAVIFDDVIDSTVYDNSFINQSKKQEYKTYNLVDVVRSKDISFSSNKIVNSSENGISINGGKNFVISENKISGSIKSGVLLNESVSKSKVSGNTIKKSKENGIIVKKDCQDIFVSKNKIEDSEGNGIVINNNCIENINCNDNKIVKTKNAILITDKSSVNLQGNSFNENKRNIGIGNESNGIIGKPQNLIASSVTDSSMLISWTTQEEATGYRIYSKKSTDEDYQLISDQMERAYQAENLLSKTTYQYNIVPYYVQKETIFDGVTEEAVVKTKFNIEKAYFEYVNEVAFTGKERTQQVKVITLNSLLTPNIDYVVEYSNNINIGTAQMKIIGIGDYYGEIVKEFEIMPIETDNYFVASNKGHEGFTMSKTTSEKGYTVKCKVNDYVSLADNDSTKSPIQITLDSFKVTNVYQISVRSYTTVDGIRIYGTWL